MERMIQRGFLFAVFAIIFGCNLASAQDSSWEEATRAAARAETQGRSAEARQFYQDAVREAEEVGSDDWRVATSLADLGDFYYRQTDYSEAEALFRRGLEIQLSTVPNSFEELRSARMNLAKTLVAEGNSQEAANLYLADIESATTFGKDDLRLATTLQDLANFYGGQPDRANAERLYEQVEAIQILNLDPGSGAILGTVERLAALYEGDGKFADAETLLRASIAKKERLPRGHLSLIASLNDLAEFLERRERFTEAELYYERALHQFPTTATAYKDSNVAIVMRNYARLLRTTDQPNKAAEYQNDADTFDPRVNHPTAE
jgi:tetratricopeptide (TPR) repeat protein